MIALWQRHRGWLVPVLLGLVVVGALMLPELAEGRVGGGQSFGRSSGRSGGRGFGGGGGGGGGEVDLLFLLLHLCIRYPALGIPVTLAVMGFFVARAVWNRADGHQVQRSRGYLPPAGMGDGGGNEAFGAAGGGAARMPTATARPRSIPGLDRLREQDAGFSMPVLLDFVVLVYRRAYEAIGNRQWSSILPYVAPSAQKSMLEVQRGVQEISEIVVGGVSVLKVEQRGEEHHLHVQFECTHLVTMDDGSARRVQVREQWTFRRAIGATSPAPEAVERLGCPNCGAAIEVDAMGACRNCDSPITRGQLAWQAVFTRVLSRQGAVVPEVGWTQGGNEGSVLVPIVQDPQLSAEMRSLQGRHPEFDPRGFGTRVEHVYRALQAAWSSGRWNEARPYVTDRMFQTLRFWVERYTAHGLRNQLTDVELERVRIVKVQVDAWYESITVRLWGSMKDSIVRSDGKVVGGNPNQPRRFSEYWTFLRAAGGEAGTRADQPGCPSCGAPLDRINQAGICGYCDTKITTGRFDWVLARIEQPEAYRG